MASREVNLKQVYNRCSEICAEHKRKNFDLILGLLDDGVIPAFIISRKLDLENNFRILNTDKDLPEDLIFGIRKGLKILIVGSKTNIVKERLQEDYNKVYYCELFSKDTKMPWEI